MPIRRQSVVVASPPAVPTGVPGTWGSPIFDDEFVGTALDLTKWWVDGSSADDESAANVSVAGGFLVLQVSTGGGALISTGGAVAGGGGFEVYPGDFVEASINFAGSGASIDNYPAFFIYGENWPADGENDIAEGINNALTVNYHSPSGAHNFGVIPGSWAGALHTFGIYRGANYCQVYYDGTLVEAYSTDDDGGPQRIILATGPPTNSSSPVYGSAGEMLVDYVRTWSGTPTATTRPTAALIDKFPGTTLNAQWGSYGTATVANELALDATAGYSAIYAQNVYNLTASQFAVKLTPPAALSSTGSMQFGVELDVGQASGSTGGLGWDYSDAGAAAFTAYYKNASGAQTSLASITWAAGEVFWARIRESGGTVYWDYCTDGVSWVNAASVADASLVALTALYPQIFAGHYDADADQTAYVQYVNATSSSGAILTATTSDVSLSNDSASRVLQQIARAASDASVLSDVAGALRHLARTASDTSASSDAVSRSLPLARAAQDASTGTDLATRQTAGQRASNDTTTVSDMAGSGRAAARAASDTSAVSDAAARQASAAHRTTTDASATSDAVAGSTGHGRTSADTSLTASTVTRGAGIPRAAGDASTTSDAAQRATPHARSASDVTLTTVLAVSSRNAARTAADVSASTDGLTVIRRRHVGASDTTLTSDVATRTVHVSPPIRFPTVAVFTAHSAAATIAQRTGRVIIAAKTSSAVITGRTGVAIFTSQTRSATIRVATAQASIVKTTTAAALSA